jgi:gamma-glutamyl hercynylcysteine S-oxide synthase
MLYNPQDHFAVAQAVRQGDAAVLRAAQADSRALTLRRFATWAGALADLRVPLRGEFNLPLWELGHIGWFQEWWTVRNPLWREGAAADPLAARVPSVLAGADALYDSSAVAHATRWSLPLPGSAATLDWLARVMEAALQRLAAAGTQDAALYFFRLALFHEDMHGEAALYMAANLGVPMPDVVAPCAAAAGEIVLPAASHVLGWPDAGFAFDNEVPAREVMLPACVIDAAPVTNARYAAFVEAGGYADARWWSAAGLAWREAQARRMPRFWRHHGDRWQQQWFGEWLDLEPEAPVMRVTCHEAEAWCAWAGRRLPGEAQWERAALGHAGFAWGEVWEWTADAFEPYPGFVAHPYRDYSAPWFGTRRVLRGASVATHARMRHPRYRNFFPPDRDDILAGFRSCAR